MLIEAILTGKPFRRPSWVTSLDEYQWVVYNPSYSDFDWANSDGTSSGNVFGTLEQICEQNGEADDYEVLNEPK